MYLIHSLPVTGMFTSPAFDDSVSIDLSRTVLVRQRVPLVPLSSGTLLSHPVTVWPVMYKRMEWYDVIAAKN